MQSPRRIDKSQELATANTFGLIIKYSIPTIVGMLVNALYVFIDRLFVGHLPGGQGELGIAGINIAMPVTTIIFAVAMFAGAGAGANVSLSLGRGEREKAERFIGNGTSLGIAVAFVLSVLFIVFRKPILGVFGASGLDCAPYAEQYLTVMLIGTTINTFGFCLSRFVLAQGFTTVSMTSMFIGVGVNVVLAPLFLFVFHWGVAGSAVATVVAQTASAGYSLVYFLRGRMPLALRFKNLKPDWEIIGKIASIGVSPGSLQLAMAFVQVVLNKSLNGYGDAAISAMSVVNALSAVLLMPIFGINQGVQPIIGFNYGAKLYRRVRRLLIQAIWCAVILMTAFWAALMLGAQPIVQIFGAANQGLIDIGPKAIRLYLMALPLVGFQVISSNYFQAVGKPLHSLALTMTRQVLFLLPAVLLLPLLFGMDGVFAAGGVADTLATVMTSIFFLVELKHLDKLAQDRDREISEAEDLGDTPGEQPAG